MKRPTDADGFRLLGYILALGASVWMTTYVGLIALVWVATLYVAMVCIGHSVALKQREQASVEGVVHVGHYDATIQRPRCTCGWVGTKADNTEAGHEFFAHFAEVRKELET